jgi:hypothetical protein
MPEGSPRDEPQGMYHPRQKEDEAKEYVYENVLTKPLLEKDRNRRQKHGQDYQDELIVHTGTSLFRRWPRVDPRGVLEPLYVFFITKWHACQGKKSPYNPKQNRFAYTPSMSDAIDNSMKAMNGLFVGVTRNLSIRIT